MATVVERRERITTPVRELNVDAQELAARLEKTIEGEVRFDAGSRGLYSRDASNYRQVPIGVVIPRSIDDVLATVDACREHGAPILARGGGTSLAGQCCNVAVVLDFSKHVNKILEIDPASRTARMQPGVVLDDLREAAKQHGLTFGPDPATHLYCTLGGMIGNNSCGIHSVMAGRTIDNVEELEVLTYDGARMRVGPTSDEEFERIVSAGGRRAEIYRRLRELRDRYADQLRERIPEIPRRVSGYDLNELLPENGFHVARALVGTECTCALVLEAKLRLVPHPPCRTVVVLGYPDVYSAADHVLEVLELEPIGLEGMDRRLEGSLHKKGLRTEEAQLLPEGDGYLLVEFGGETQDEANDKAARLKEALNRNGNAPHIAIYDDPQDQEDLWNIRESGLGATAFVPGERDSWPGWEDAAVHPARVGDYLRDFRKLLNKYNYGCSLYGHFGDGCVHVRIDFKLDSEEGRRRYREFAYEAAELVVSYDGSFSGEHGDGQSRAELLPKMYGEELVEAFREFKSIWDPQWKMNPGKVIDPYPLDANLALGSEYHPMPARTHFQFPEDEGFRHATIRCVGVGKCRRTEGGVMCPSYMVTREEKHTTRGRARLLFEMMQGDILRDGWQSEEVKDSLDLCLACKGCKGECPVNVDMAAYKAEFLSHYYEAHWRPRSAYAMGWIFRWARLASLVPALVNWLGHAPLLKQLVKRIGGIAPQREMPRFANETFLHWFARRVPRNVGQRRLVLWPDTFTNYFHPEVAKAAVRVIEDAGFHVGVPQVNLCCGRPLYDYGMLEQAKRQLRQILDVLREDIRRGVPVVGLEPSCISVFRDELLNFFPNDDDAKKLASQSYMFSEFLTQKAPDYEPPRLERRALIHAHCHHRSVLEFEEEPKLLKKMGLDVEVLDSGCCGMAGSFGFEEEHFDVSVECGERVLLPAVRAAEPETFIIADGFSCQQQIAQLTRRRALHTAQVIELALNHGPKGPHTPFPEAACSDGQLLIDTPGRAITAAALAGVAALAIGGLLYWKIARTAK